MSLCSDIPGSALRGNPLNSYADLYTSKPDGLRFAEYSIFFFLEFGLYSLKINAVILLPQRAF